MEIKIIKYLMDQLKNDNYQFFYVDVSTGDVIRIDKTVTDAVVNEYNCLIHLAKENYLNNNAQSFRETVHLYEDYDYMTIQLDKNVTYYMSISQFKAMSHDELIKQKKIYPNYPYWDDLIKYHHKIRFRPNREKFNKTIMYYDRADFMTIKIYDPEPVMSGGKLPNPDVTANVDEYFSGNTVYALDIYDFKSVTPEQFKQLSETYPEYPYWKELQQYQETLNETN